MFTIIGADGKEYGPVTADQIKQWMAENRLTPSMQARRAGATDWLRIGDLPELIPAPRVSFFQAAAGVSGQGPGAAPSAQFQPSAFASDAAADPLAATPGAPEPIVFTGEWAEYFKIWIVNVLLTI